MREKWSPFLNRVGLEEKLLTNIEIDKTKIKKYSYIIGNGVGVEFGSLHPNPTPIPIYMNFFLIFVLSISKLVNKIFFYFYLI